MRVRGFIYLLVLIAISGTTWPVHAQAGRAQRELLQRLEENQAKLYEQLKAKDARLDELEAEVKRSKSAAPITAEPVQAPEALPPAASIGGLETDAVSPSAPAAAPAQFGTYVPGSGFRLARTKWGEVNFGAYTYVRYLNQKGLKDQYTNGLGTDVQIDKRDDVELNKVKIQFSGWFLDPSFRYVFYTWTNNTAQGQGAQVVVAGALTYSIADAVTVGAGISSLPTTCSTQGNYPNWLGVDHRTIRPRI